MLFASVHIDRIGQTPLWRPVMLAGDLSRECLNLSMQPSLVPGIRVPLD